MSTTYSYEIQTCYRDKSDIVLNILVEWTATKEDSGVTNTATKRDIIALDPAGDSPIDYATLDETTIRSWYQNKLSTKLMITDVAGNTAEDEKTIEERVKETLDNDLEASIYLKQGYSDDTPVDGLPY
jgi:hypothetical protein